eukprot:SAG31_NODE_20805_length_565_cov_0.690987_1_plen_56_part_00
MEAYKRLGVAIATLNATTLTVAPPAALAAPCTGTCEWSWKVELAVLVQKGTLGTC